MNPEAAALRRIIAEKESGAEDAAACWADYGKFCEYVKTVYEETPEHPVTAPYPWKQFEFLRRYHAWYTEDDGGLYALDKTRGMLVTTDPLLWTLWQSLRIAAGYLNRPEWQCAVLRHSVEDAKQLIERITIVYDLLPDFLRSPLHTRNRDELRVENGGRIKVLNTLGTAGRGEYWDLVLLDEAAYQDRLAENIRGFARARRKLCPSTVNGRGNTFEIIMHDRTRYPGAKTMSLRLEDHPDRIPGTPQGDAFAERKRGEGTEVDFQIEYLCNYDVYKSAGYYTADYNPACVRLFEWDGESTIVIGMDYSYNNPAALWAFANASHQWCRHQEDLSHEVSLEDYCDMIFERTREDYPGCRVKIAPDPFRGEQHGSTAETDMAVIRRVARAKFHKDVWVGAERVHQIKHRPPMHRILRLLFAKDQEGLFGTLIHPQCELLIQGFGGAYGPKENATPHQVNDLEEPDPGRLHVHVMDADRYGYVQYGRKLKTEDRTDERPRSRVVKSAQFADVSRRGRWG